MVEALSLLLEADLALDFEEEETEEVEETGCFLTREII
jgi:hypothetical protein